MGHSIVSAGHAYASPPTSMRPSLCVGSAGHASVTAHQHAPLLVCGQRRPCICHGPPACAPPVAGSAVLQPSLCRVANHPVRGLLTPVPHPSKLAAYCSPGNITALHCPAHQPPEWEQAGGQPQGWPALQLPEGALLPAACRLNQTGAYLDENCCNVQTEHHVVRGANRV